MLTHIHPFHLRFTCRTSSRIKGTGAPSSKSGPVPEPPSAQSPFARLGRYPRRRDVQHLVRRRYPSFIAHTDSCVRPKSSLPISFSLYGRSLQVAVSPCWMMALPDVISTICVKALGPLPRRVPYDPVRLDVLALGLDASIERTSASPQSRRARHAKEIPCNATSTERGISGLQSFANVQAPLLARPPGCTYRCDSHRAAGPFTSRNEHEVTQHEP